MRSLRSRFALVAALGLSAATFAHAQRPAGGRRAATPPAPAANGAPAVPGPSGPDGAGPGRMGRGPGGPGARGGRGNPAAMLLGMRQQLELTDDQVKRLEALQNVTPKSTASDQMRARADLMDAMQGDGNLTAARTALDKMSRIRTDEMLARLKARQDARAVLTAAQKSKLDSFRGAMGPRGGRAKGMRKGMRGRGGPGAGFPGGGFQGGGVRGFRQGPPMGPGMPQGMRPNMMGPGMGQGMGPQMGPGQPPRGRRGGEPDSTGTPQ